MVSNRIIKIDLNKKTKNVVQMVQGDTNRKLTINVYDSDEPYLVNGVGGETIHGAVYIEKPDGTTCGYDTLEDDSPAVTGSGNTLTVYFVPQATTAHGWAYMTVSIFDDEGVELNTFGLDLYIDKKATATISADYWNLKSIEGLTAAVEGLTQQMVRSVNFATPDSNGNVSLLPWQLPYNGVVGGQQVGDVEEALDRLARMQAEIIDQSIKDTLINALSHVAWTDEHGQDYVDALEQAMRTKLVSISAVFSQGSAVIYDTDDLDTLRQYLTVTALYSDTTTRTVTAYTLSGTLTDGTSTITVSYGGKTATFNVTVTARVLFEWKPSDGLDSLAITQSSGTPSYTLRSDALRINLVQSMQNTSLISIVQAFQVTNKYKVSVEYANLLRAKNTQIAVTARFDENNNARVVAKSQNQVVAIVGTEISTSLPEYGKLSMVYDKVTQTTYAYVDDVLIGNITSDAGTSTNTAVVWANTTNLDYIDIKRILIERV